MIRKLLRILAIVTAVVAGPIAAVVVATATPAFASQPYEQCDVLFNNGGIQPFNCLNAWNGGPFGKTYTKDVTNDKTNVEYINGRCNANNDLTNLNCPAPGVPAGLQIFQLRYDNQSNACWGTDTTPGSSEYGGAELTGCNSTSTGYGGGIGTVQIQEVFPNLCGSVAGYFAINSYWTNQDGGGNSFLGMEINDGGNGTIVYMNGRGTASPIPNPSGWFYPWGNGTLGSC